jgi:hypothetical protein
MDMKNQVLWVREVLHPLPSLPCAVTALLLCGKELFFTFQFIAYYWPIAPVYASVPVFLLRFTRLAGV